MCCVGPGWPTPPPPTRSSIIIERRISFFVFQIFISGKKPKKLAETPAWSKQCEVSELQATEANRNSWRRFFLPPIHASTFTLTAPPHWCTFFSCSSSFPSLCFLIHTWTNIHMLFFLPFLLCCYPRTSPAPLACPGHQSAFARDRGAVRASQSEALTLSQSDRATGRNVPNKQPVILPCPFTYSSLSKQSADRVGKSTGTP